jgi:hypothetical protein
MAGNLGMVVSGGNAHRRSDIPKSDFALQNKNPQWRPRAGQYVTGMPYVYGYSCDFRNQALRLPAFFASAKQLTLSCEIEGKCPRPSSLPGGVATMSMLSLQIPSGRAHNISMWSRLLRFIEATQTRKADVVIRQHCHLLPREMETAGLRLDSRSEKNLPFMH